MAPWEFLEPTADEYYFGNDTEASDQESIYSESEDASFDYYDDYSYDNDDNNTPKFVSLAWKQLVIGNVHIELSNEGDIRTLSDGQPSLFASSTKGIPLTGTPYFVYYVGNKLMYVHELVYIAFKGSIPDGWEVRHRKHTRSGQYLNTVSNLTILPIINVTRATETHH